jgi:hypothetical protein
VSWGGEITRSLKLSCALNIARLKITTSRKVNVAAIFDYNVHPMLEDKRKKHRPDIIIKNVNVLKVQMEKGKLDENEDEFINQSIYFYFYMDSQLGLVHFLSQSFLPREAKFFDFSESEDGE